jgi:hypothetical protein
VTQICVSNMRLVSTHIHLITQYMEPFSKWSCWRMFIETWLHSELMICDQVCNCKYWMWCKETLQQSLVRGIPIPICIPSHSGMRLIQVLKFGSTRNLLDWYTNYNRPTFLCFCQENEFPIMALLPLDIAPGHSANCTEVWFIFVYMPPNTNTLMQLMDHRLIAAFKAFSVKCWWQWYTIKTKLLRIILVLIQYFEGHY